MRFRRSLRLLVLASTGALCGAFAACTDDSNGGPAANPDASLRTDGATTGDSATPDGNAPDGTTVDASTDGSPGDGGLEAGSGGKTFVTFAHYANEPETYTASIDRASGAVTPVDMNPSLPASQGIAFGGGTSMDAQGVIGTHTPKFLYASARLNNEICGFTQDGTTGQLTQIKSADGGASLGSMPQPMLMALSSNDKFLYATSYSNGGVHAFAVDATTGQLTFVNSAATGTTAYGLGIERTGKFLYVTNSGSDNVSAYSLHPTTGALTKINAADAGADISSGGDAPTFALAHPTKDVLYVVNSSSATVATFSIDASGTLHSMGVSAALTGALTLAIDATGSRLYVASGFAEIPVFNLDSNGMPTPGPTATFIQNDISAIALDPLAPILYAAGNARLDSFRLPSDGGAPELLASDNGFYGFSPGRLQMAINPRP